MNKHIKILMVRPANTYPARYADKYFHTRFKKVINDAAAMFDVRVIAVTVRENGEGQEMVAV